MNANEKFEIKAHLFYQNTGLLAPGKDEPIGCATDRDIRLAAWTSWREAHMEYIDKVLAAVEYVMGEDND